MTESALALHSRMLCGFLLARYAERSSNYELLPVLAWPYRHHRDYHPSWPTEL